MNKEHSMDIQILGSLGEIEVRFPSYSNKSGVLIDNQLLLDVGERSYLNYYPKWILMTHLHPDHAYFMRRGQQEIPETDAQLFAPESPFKEIS